MTKFRAASGPELCVCAGFDFVGCFCLVCCCFFSPFGIEQKNRRKGT